MPSVSSPAPVACPPTCTDDDPLHLASDPLRAARELIAREALTPTPVPAPAGTGLVGLELELHLVDLHRPAERPAWSRVLELVAALPAMPFGSSVTLEPGGQIELSTPPTAGIAASVAALRADERVLRTALAEHGFGAAPLGADPARPTRRINPSARYAAMASHFAAQGCAGSGTAMMTATAALQVNLDAGPPAGWTGRVRHVHALGPVLTAISACSPLLAGRASGWRSMRQETWQCIDVARTDPPPLGPTTDVPQAWADYALAAPVMLVRDDTPHDPAGATPVTDRIPFADWLRGAGPVARAPRRADLDYHLTTLFPPVRLRGYLELRCLDAVPDRWWPGLATIATVLIDQPDAAAAAAEAVAPVAELWTEAARDGLRDPRLRAAAVRCVELAVAYAPTEMAPDVQAYAELVASGRTPGDALLAHATETDPLQALVAAATEGAS